MASYTGAKDSRKKVSTSFVAACCIELISSFISSEKISINRASISEEIRRSKPASLAFCILNLASRLFSF